MNPKRTQRSLLVMLAVLTGLLTHAQENFKCGTDAMRREAIARDPHILQRESNLEAFIQQWIAEHADQRDADTVVYTIPVVFHILHMNGPENISNEQVLDAMEVLNRDYRRLNPDIANLVPGYEQRAADIRVQFKLATIDPLGNCTNGIQRIRTVETFVGDNGSKLFFWPRAKYLNVWTCAKMENGVAGYSQYPSAVDGSNGEADGVIILHDYIGRIGTSSEGRSRALTHEVGHYLNLPHVWGDNNGADDAPDGYMSAECGDDFVFDTPITRGHSNCDIRFDFFCSEKPMEPYAFDDVSTTSGTTDPLGNIYLTDTLRDDTNLVMSPFSAVGVSSNSALDGAFAFTSWPGDAADSLVDYTLLTGALDPNKYYEFTLSPELIHAMTLSNITFKVARSETGPRTFAVRSSTNGFSTNLTASVIPANPGLLVKPGNIFFITADSTQQFASARVTLSGNLYLRATGPITFRIYGWNAEDAAGHFSVDDVNVGGVTGIIENVENYMEYSYCSKMFTTGQMLRMRAALASPAAQRSNLWSAANLAATGTDGINDRVCAPIAEFTVFDQAISGVGSGVTPAGTSTYCIGDEVSFHDNSQGGFPTAWSWSFEDGQPATSDLRNPVVTFTSGGWKTVSLTVSNDQGQSSTTDDYAVFISYDSPDIPGAISESFETAFSEVNYIAHNYEGNDSEWSRTSDAGHWGRSSMRMDGFNTFGFHDFPIDDGANDIDALVTPTMDLTWLQNGDFTFWYAYSTKVTSLEDATERLEVWSSDNCGREWTRRLNLENEDLITDGVHGGYYIPNSESAWMQASFPIFQSMISDQVRFKFVYYSSAASNNLYVDDINITGTVAVGEIPVQAAGLFLAPNPTDGQLNITYTLPGAGKGELVLVDAQGRTVWTRATREVAQERVTIDTRELGLAPGVYMFRLAHELGNSTARLVVR